jgi:hypothetical protein
MTKEAIMIGNGATGSDTSYMLADELVEERYPYEEQYEYDIVEE